MGEKVYLAYLQRTRIDQSIEPEVSEKGLALCGAEPLHAAKLAIVYPHVSIIMLPLHRPTIDRQSHKMVTNAEARKGQPK